MNMLKRYGSIQDKELKKYHDLYLETDVLLLIDIFMNYIIMCLKNDGLDPSHYVSASRMFNDSLYKTNNLQYSDYNSDEPISWILYKDFNAFYSDAMTQYMPTEILEIPMYLHDFFADYPLALEK
ncbi:5275_t:CDS:2 [Funneliformis geosporum]|nr:5275_t:CDS:2 [Funneliformis geosporum]